MCTQKKLIKYLHPNRINWLSHTINYIFIRLEIMYLINFVARYTKIIFGGPLKICVVTAVQNNIYCGLHKIGNTRNSSSGVF
jgi:hypothetical protein